MPLKYFSHNASGEHASTAKDIRSYLLGLRDKGKLLLKISAEMSGDNRRDFWR